MDGVELQLHFVGGTVLTIPADRDTAEDLLAEGGEAAVTVRAVATRVGVTTPSVYLVLFGGGGGLYWGMGAGWGIGPIGLIIAVLVVAFLLNGRRRRL